MTAENLWTGPRQRPLIGYALMLLAGLLVIVSVVGLLTSVIAFQSNESLARIIGLFFLCLLYPAFQAWNEARRHFVKRANVLLSRDKRPPILYLRSFHNDKSFGNSENAFSKLFAPIGPLVAIGDPNDSLPQLGAFRDYVPDAEWQEVVSTYIGRSRLVLLSIGKTPGLAWELTRCRELLPPTRLIILVSCGESEYDLFRDAATCRGIGLPDYPQAPDYAFFNGVQLRSLYEPLSGIISFDEGWKAQMTPVVDPGHDFGREVTIGDHLTDVLLPRGIVLPKFDVSGRAF